MSKGHKKLEKNIILMSVFVVVVVSLGGLVEILPLIFQDQVRTPSEGIEPYPPLQLAGRDIYVREGCYNCHSQMIRPFRSETERYGPYSVAGESVYDRPFQWGSKRTGPDLARVGARYSDEWHVIHLINPRDVVPESNMPGYPWLLEETLDGALVQKKMSVLQTLGDPYTDAEIAAAADAVNGKTEMEALVAYLQGLGLARSGR
jgi:cytochrome c oxidase cbb3-type subunit 2